MPHRPSRSGEVSRRRSGSAIGRRRCRPSFVRRLTRSPPAVAAGSSKRPNRSGRQRRARRASSIRATSSSAAVGSPVSRTVELAPPLTARAASRATRSPPARSDVGPAPILAILVGVFNSALFVLLRGSAGGQLPLLILAASLGAWAGDALGARLGFDLVRIGDFRLVAASLVAWVGIAMVSIVAVLGPTRRPRPGP